MSVEVKIIPIHETVRSGKCDILINQTTLDVSRTAYDLQDMANTNPNFKVSEVYISEHLDPEQSREDMYGERCKEVEPAILLEWFNTEHKGHPLCESDLAIMAYLSTISCKCLLFFE